MVTPTPTPGVGPTPTPVAPPIVGCAHCPLKLTFRDTRDFLGIQGEIGLAPSFDPTTADVLIEVSNAGGLVYLDALLPGDLERRGRNFIFKDSAAKTGPGSRGDLYKVEMKLGLSGLWRIKTKSYSDLSAATDPEMTVRIIVNGTVFETTDTWTTVAKGFKLPRFP